MEDEQDFARFSMEGEYEGGEFINGEFYFTKQKEKRQMTKDEQIYGVWAEDGDDDDNKRGKGRKGGNSSKANILGGVNFISKGQITPDEPEKPAPAPPPPVSAAPPNAAEQRWASKASSSSNSSSSSSSSSSSQTNKRKVDPKRDTDFAKWSKHTTGFGLKMLQKMGWKGGGGGKDEKGMVNPIEAKQRGKNEAIGARGSERSEKSRPAEDRYAPSRDDEEQDEPEEIVEKPREINWKKGPRAKRVYKTAADVMAEKEKETTARGSEVILDMRGPQVRYTSLDKIKSDVQSVSGTPTASGPFPELQHNVKFLVQMTEDEIHKIDREMRHAKDSLVSLRHEQQRLQTVAREEEQAIERTEEVIALVKSCQQRVQQIAAESKSVMDRIDTVAWLVQTLCEQYPKEWQNMDLPDLVEVMIWPLLKALVHTWEPLAEEHTRFSTSTDDITSVIGRWRTILISDDDSGQPSKPLNHELFRKMINDIVLPKVRATITGQWKTRQFTIIIPMLKQLGTVFPNDILYLMLTQLILPKLQHEVHQWNPRRDPVPIHTWVLPWRQIIPDDMMQPMYQVLRYKLAIVLQEWHPSDTSALTVIKPWQEAWREADMDVFVGRSILPKLINVLRSEFIVNPKAQVVEPFQWILRWEPLLAVQDSVRMLVLEFFPKWFQALFAWLSVNADFEEVSGWYLGWKNLLPEGLREHPQIKAMFNRGLDLMNEAVSGNNLGPLMDEIMSELTGKPVTTAKPKPAMPNIPGISDDPQVSLKEMLQRVAGQQSITFMPNVKRGLVDGKQVFFFGKCNIYFDTNCIFVFDGEAAGWHPIGVEDLLLRVQ